MSQVVVTNDKLKSDRERSRAQEHKIDREGRFSRWRRNDISKGYDPFAKLVGLAVLPILLIWTALGTVAAVAMWFAISVCRVLALLVQPLIRK